MANKEDKRKTAVEKKMNSAAVAANIYLNEDAVGSKNKRISSTEAKRNRNKKLMEKIFTVARNSVIYAFCILVISVACLIPLKSAIASFVQNNYLAEEQEFESDVQLKKFFSGSEVTKGKIYKHEITEPSLNTAFAKIYSEILGINCYIYYAESYQALKVGVTMLENGHFPGYRTATELYGYNTTYFLGLKNAKRGDTITITTNYGVFNYEVASAIVTNKSNDTNLSKKDEDILIIKTDYPFGTLNGVSDKTYVVTANRVSGPSVIY